MENKFYYQASEGEKTCFLSRASADNTEFKTPQLAVEIESRVCSWARILYKILSVKIPKHQSDSFSIIEMIIVIMIIGIISTMTLANYRTGQRIEDLITQTQKVVMILKRAQNMALTGYVPGATRTDYGYGVNIIDHSNYRLFIDNPGSSNYQYDSGDTIIQDFSLPSGIIFDYESDPDCWNIVFSVPLGAVYCNGTALGTNDAKYLKTKQTTEGRIFYIRINYSGQISIATSQY